MEADRIRGEIRAETFQNATTPPPADSRVRVTELGALFVERTAKARGKVTWRDDEAKIQAFAAFALPRTGTTLGVLSVDQVTEDDCDVFLASLRARELAASTRNKYLQVVKALSVWGVRKGYLAAPWILPGSDLKREQHAKRDRRLAPDEEHRLLAEAGPRLYRLIVAGLETGCRLKELLLLQWGDIDLTRGELRIRASNAKTRKLRHIPIVARLRAVLE
ncbi:MAG: tyrosine-type recombinase/integrase, partial [bacterium]